jgi:hypothetical protein
MAKLVRLTLAKANLRRAEAGEKAITKRTGSSGRGSDNHHCSPGKNRRDGDNRTVIGTGIQDCEDE